VICAQSVNYVERFIIDEGHAPLRVEFDYGYDMTVRTHDPEGYTEPGWISLQLKASESLVEVDGAYVFDLDVRDYNLWVREFYPVILVLFDAGRRRAYWLHIQAYFRLPGTVRPVRGAKTIRVRIPRGRTVNRRAVAAWRDAKNRLGEPFTLEE
jgi:hypothetical protein